VMIMAIVVMTSILYSAEPTNIAAVGTNGPDPISPSSPRPSPFVPTCASKIFVRRRTLLIREWLLSRVERRRFWNLARRRGRNNASGDGQLLYSHVLALRDPCKCAERLSRDNCGPSEYKRIPLCARLRSSLASRGRAPSAFRARGCIHAFKRSRKRNV